MNTDQKIDTLLIQVAALDAKLTAHVKHTIPQMGERLNNHGARIGSLEVAMAATKVRVGLWGGLAGLIAIVWQVVSTLGG